MATNTMLPNIPPDLAAWRGRLRALRDEMLELAQELADTRRLALAAATGSADDITCGDTTLEASTRKLRIGGKSFLLTASEFRMVAAMLQEPGRVCARMELLGDVCGVGIPSQTRLIDAHANRLRKKLGAARWHLDAVRGFGYRWKTEVACQ